ncbi:MAG: hypothetical protein LLG04_09805 [Parachlamydia sp.]|nr:hypothetical protein [Parachlamydia sp.]
MAIQNAARANKHLYIFFYKDQNDKTQRFQSIFDRAIQKMGDQARSLKVKTTDPSAKPLIDRFNLKRSPMPFVIVLAPNGAITVGFPSFTEDQLKDSLTSPGAASCLKALQDRKLVLICLQNSRTAHNEEAMKGVNEFKADPKFGEATVIVKIDPSNAEEAKFLHQLALDTNSSQAVTVLISPPAQVVATYQGPTTKATLVSDLQKANSECCPGGCCPGGCCPGGKCG